MHNAARKLHSQRGASIIFALLVFMLCAFGGVAALVSASANAGRYTRLERDQQQYLSAASAAGLLRDELRGEKITATLRMRHIHSWWYRPETTSGGETQYIRYDYDQYTFLDKDGDPTAAPMDACVVEEVTSGAADSDVVQALWKFLEPYFKNSLLQSATPSYFFEKKDTIKSLDYSFESGGTGSLPAADTSGKRLLVITGAETGAPAGSGDWAAWHDTLGTVHAEMSGIGDFGLRAEVSLLPDDGRAPLYATVFELPAQVERDIASNVTRQDNVADKPTLPADAPPGITDGVTSYGQEIIVNTVTVTVTWADTVPTVTRLY